MGSVGTFNRPIRNKDYQRNGSFYITYPYDRHIRAHTQYNIHTSGILVRKKPTITSPERERESTEKGKK